MMRKSKFIKYKGVKYLRGNECNGVIELYLGSELKHLVRVNIHGKYYKFYEKQTIEKKVMLAHKKIIECAPTDFKNEIKNLESLGIIPDRISADPIKYRYTVTYYKENNVDGDVSEEQWKDIPGIWFGHYQMSSLGRVRSIKILADYDTQVFQVGNFRKSVNRKRLFKELWP